ncbi:MORN repeat-containing protein [Fulvivirga lutea]|uniref:MORN repeat-containing protein n=1 Tax=Fulvivirga lutea TaxID=2810512 RepID=A0A975A0J0_9BACT|nr:hypothetical protein [Fulvivirga lutea]QSE96477.1 hypothetical protein JR347_12810 [Fulvivirga lutea]
MFNQPKRLLFSYLLTIVFAALAFYFFTQTAEDKSDSSKLETLQNSNESLQRDIKALLYLDSLIQQGRYADVMKVKENAHKDSIPSWLVDAIDQRIAIVNMLKAKSQERIVEEDTTQADEGADAESTRYATPAEVRKYDSLIFALDKANHQINNLERQLKQDTRGDYITFKTKKGREVHYVGSVKNKMANGKGIGLLNTGSRYEGYWKDNMRHGEGKFFWPDGEYYEGSYVNDERSGIGTYSWPNGDRFKGEWAGDMRNGQGVFYNKEGEVIAKGIWKNDELVTVVKN